MPRKKKLILEIRANEYEMRDANANVPWSAEEIAADAARCREAGASIIHFHARAADGSPAFGADAYRAVIAAIRECSDLLIHSTLGASDRPGSAEERLAHIVRLAEDGYRPDFAPLDMGTSNIDMFDAGQRRFRSEEATYVNTTGTLRYFAETLARLGIKPYLQIWNVPMLRWAAAFETAGFVKAPLFMGLLLSQHAYLGVHPASVKGLEAYLGFLPEGVPLEWTAMVGGTDILPLADTILVQGGHISVGLGDYAYPGLSNAQVAEKIVRLADNLGIEVATPAEARRMLGMS